MTEGHHSTDPWPEIKQGIIDRLKASPPAAPKPKPDYRAAYQSRMKRQRKDSR